jgi:hypothetical protein
MDPMMMGGGMMPPPTPPMPGAVPGMPAPPVPGAPPAPGMMVEAARKVVRQKVEEYVAQNGGAFNYYRFKKLANIK